MLIKKTIKTEEKGNKLILSYNYNDKVPNEQHRNKIQTQEIPIPKKFDGKGEWVAKTLDDAKQMAQDFHEGVS